MTDPVSKGEIEDVLSSIRRLVSEESRKTQGPTPADPRPASRDKLVLTPALRVTETETDSETASAGPQGAAVSPPAATGPDDSAADAPDPASDADMNGGPDHVAPRQPRLEPERWTPRPVRSDPVAADPLSTAGATRVEGPSAAATDTPPEAVRPETPGLTGDDVAPRETGQLAPEDTDTPDRAFEDLLTEAEEVAANAAEAGFDPISDADFDPELEADLDAHPDAGTDADATDPETDTAGQEEDAFAPAHDQFTWSGARASAPRRLGLRTEDTRSWDHPMAPFINPGAATEGLTAPDAGAATDSAWGEGHPVVHPPRVDAPVGCLPDPDDPAADTAEDSAGAAPVLLAASSRVAPPSAGAAAWPAIEGDDSDETAQHMAPPEERTAPAAQDGDRVSDSLSLAAFATSQAGERIPDGPSDDMDYMPAGPDLPREAPLRMQGAPLAPDADVPMPPTAAAAIEALTAKIAMLEAQLAESRAANAVHDATARATPTDPAALQEDLDEDEPADYTGAPAEQAVHWHPEPSDEIPADRDEEAEAEAEAAAALREAQAANADIFGTQEAILDEDTLRELVTDIVREELQGALGERITRNVRKLVRREIHRALTAQDLD
ncbi:hypothetical protein [Marinibacterium profundimaris]|uniref:Uncharacterized protein n=1 Tax=Marinibacterium profundimaris TaxID=1679460 RepID=A0A225NJM2_9RHOB|nr:hypothetical protein [Marinibacterium profundimaris]OWU72451.1 hypothetical protein ATO3_15270 [Marinibacterium profundimaris]